MDNLSLFFVNSTVDFEGTNTFDQYDSRLWFGKNYTTRHLYEAHVTLQQQLHSNECSSILAK